MTSGLDPAEALEIRGGPSDRLIDRLALGGALGDHLRRRLLRQDLVGDIDCRRTIEDDHFHVAARRAVIDGTLGRRFLGPGLEVV